MMPSRYFPIFALMAAFLPLAVHSQVTLGTSPFIENFNNISGGLPTGFKIKTGATATTTGTDAVLTTAATPWNNTTGAFKNFASATGLTATSTTTEQANSTNRSLGLRQTAAIGDPGGAFVFQIANSSNKTNIKLDFKLQSLDASITRVATWRVDYGIGSAPASFSVAPSVTGDLTTGGGFKNNSITVDFSNILDNLSQEITIRIVTLSATTGAGNRPSTGIDDFTLSWTEGPSTTPIIILNDNGNTSVAFPPTQINTNTTSQSYTVRGQNLSAPVNITATTPYFVSEDNVNFVNSISVPAANAITNKTIYVRFSPTNAGLSNSTIINSSTGADDKAIAVSGEGIDPDNLTFDFNNCISGGTPGSAFSSYSVTGAQKWACSGFGQNGTKGVDMNGFSGGAVDNEDWLISPPLHFGSLNLPILRFYSRGEFTGPSLQLLLSTDYDGTSNPNTATWTDLHANFPALTNTWTLTDGINLSSYKSFPNVYIAFKYISSPELGAARWTLDDISITNRTNLLSTSPASLNFNEITVGSNSAGLPVNVQAIGYGPVTITAPAGYEVSTDNAVFTNNVNIPDAEAETGTIVYARFKPASKQLKIEGKINFMGTGLDSNTVSLTGSSYPKSETFDVAAYNLSFFGSTPTNNPTPEKIQTQVNNIATVLQRLNMDVVGFEEMSNDDALNQLMAKLPGYASVTSPRWSYSFDPPDPGFPPQKIGFIYNSATTQIVEQRVLFEALYDSARTGLTTRLNNYPLSSPSSFWASGRLPFMVTFDATIGGVAKRIRVIDIHAKSASDAESYNRRVYDVKLLKDSLDAYYPNDNIIFIGDYNDRVFGSINAGSPSPYKIFVDDVADFAALTLPLDQAGRVSFISGTGLIDHIIISNELQNNNISNSTDIEDPRSYIPGYNATTASDHLPVFTRFNLSTSGPLPVTLSRLEAHQKGNFVLISWTTFNEENSSHFILERSFDGNSFIPIARVNGAGTSRAPVTYQGIDSTPLQGINYYRLKQVDMDGRATVSPIVMVMIDARGQEAVLKIYPNPVPGTFQIILPSAARDFVARVATTDGRVILQAKGSISQLNQQIDPGIKTLKAGLYILQLSNSSKGYTVKFIKQ